MEHRGYFITCIDRDTNKPKVLLSGLTEGQAKVKASRLSKLYASVKIEQLYKDK